MNDSTQHPLHGTWDLDPEHSRIGFSTRHAMVSKVRGAFNEASGILRFDGEDSDLSSAEVTVQMASIDTRNQRRDDHLRSADFFDVEQFPVMTFRYTRVDEVDDGAYIVVGDLCIRDLTRQISIPLSLLGVEVDPFGNTKAGLEGTRRLDRRDWGITWNTPLASGGVLVGDRITLEFELELTRRSEDPLDGLEDPVPSEEPAVQPWAEPGPTEG
jgi:polyisoprenoid-binding protein YceI